ncbi:MAG TPA: hypothetical protein VFC03_10180 [Acidimicrobiales bacterium]|nr:hypothetical protein [Acidimicrobiales bacterium]
MVMPGAEQSGAQRKSGVQWRRCGKPKLSHIEHRIIFVGADQADEMVDDLCHAENRQRRLFVAGEQLRYFVC